MRQHRRYSGEMNGRDLVDLWESLHGELSNDSRERFLGSSEAQMIRAYPRESIIQAVSRAKALSTILSDLQSTETLKPEGANKTVSKPFTETPKQTDADFTRKIASGKGRGFRQAERDEKNWRRRF